MQAPRLHSVESPTFLKSPLWPRNCAKCFSLIHSSQHDEVDKISIPLFKKRKLRPRTVFKTYPSLGRPANAVKFQPRLSCWVYGSLLKIHTLNHSIILICNTNLICDLFCQYYYYTSLLLKLKRESAYQINVSCLVAKFFKLQDPWW